MTKKIIEQKIDLVPLTKQMAADLGIVTSKKGILIDKKKLTDIKKFQQKVDEKVDPLQVVKVSKNLIKDDLKKRDEDLGLY